MTNKEKLDAVRVEVQNYIYTAHKAHTNITEGNFAHLLSFIDSLQEEPVNDDLEKASKEWLKPQLDKSYADYGEAKMMKLTHFDGYAMLDAIEFGAKWKEEQFEKERLKQCDTLTEEQAKIEQDFAVNFIKKYNRTPTFIDAIEYGKKLKLKEVR